MTAPDLLQVSKETSGLSESISAHDSDLWAAQTYLGYRKTGKHSKFWAHFWINYRVVSAFGVKSTCLHPSCRGDLIPYRLGYLKVAFDSDPSRVAFYFKCVWTSCRCHCRRGFELHQPRLLGVQSTTQPPFVGDIVSQMFRMHGALSAWMFDGLAAKGDIWWLMCSDVNAAPSVLWAAAALQRHKWDRGSERERQPGRDRRRGGWSLGQGGG